MTFKQIEYFQAVCRLGNISAAAEEMFVSRSVISRAIAELEEEFDTKIFLRSKNGVAPTESGKFLSQFFSSFTESCEAAKKRVGQIGSGTESRLLRLGVTPTNAYGVYHAYLAPFLEENPSIQLYIEEHSAYEAQSFLLNGDLDVFFTPVSPDPAKFDSLELYPNTNMVGVRKDHPAARKESLGVEDIVELPLGFYNAPVPFESLLRTCAQAMGKDLNVVIRTSDQNLLRELTQQGKICPYLPLDMMATWEEVRHLPLDFGSAVSFNRLIWSRALAYGKPVEVFLRYMKRQCGIPRKAGSS